MVSLVRPQSLPEPSFTIHLPAGEDLTQDTEWCELEIGGDRRRLRFHDYGELYNVPGLYETLFYDKLECISPRTVCELLGEVLQAQGRDPAELSVIDVGAGNGMVGEALRALGVGSVVGVDILPEAKKATERDRPGVYADYRAIDLTAVTATDDEYFRSVGFNCLTTVAALGFGDIPPAAFAQAYNYVRPGGLVAFTIKEDFLQAFDGTGFSRLIRRMLNDGVLADPSAQRRYRHRLAVSGEPLYYVAYVAEKVADIPADWSLG